MPQVTLTYTFATEQEALAFLAGSEKTAGKPAPTEANAASEPSAEKRGPGRPRKDAAAPATEPSPAASPSPEPSPAPAPAEAKAPTYAESGLPDLIKAAVGRDRDGVVALLKKYGAAKGDQLKPDQFDAFKAEIVKVGVSDDLS